MYSTYILFILVSLITSLPYHYNKKNIRTGRLLSPSLTLGFAPSVESVKERYGREGQGVVHKETDRMMGLDTGNPQTDFEAGMWIAALIGSLAAAIPVAFLNPSLGVKKRRSAEDRGGELLKEKMAKAIRNVVGNLEERDL